MSDDLTLLTYNCRDALSTVLSAEPLLRELETDGLSEFYFRIVQPMAQIIVKMNRKGIFVDTAKRNAAVTTVEAEIEELEHKFADLVGRPMNVNGAEFGDFLFGELGLRGSRRGDSGRWQADEETLKRVLREYPDVAPAINMGLDIRAKKKIISTFLLHAIPEEDSRVHPSFKIGPTTGRLACRRPNFQNHPAGVCRSVYCAPPGFVLVGADYSQLEIRILAVLANDAPLLEAFANGWDIHNTNAWVLFGLEQGSPVTKLQRVIAKMFLYGLMYGADDDTLHTNLCRDIPEGVPMSVVKTMTSRFFAAHPAIRAFRTVLENNVRTKRRLVNAFGRRRLFFGEIQSAIRQGYNFPMQGGGADLISDRMIKLDREIRIPPVLQVHDFVAYEVEESRGQEHAVVLKQVLEEKCPELSGYSFPVETKVVQNWAQFDPEYADL